MDAAHIDFRNQSAHYPHYNELKNGIILNKEHALSGATRIISTATRKLITLDNAEQ